MEPLAERVSETLQDEFPETCLVGVSDYEQGGVGHVYRGDWAAEKYEPEQVDETVEDLRLEAIAIGAHEQRQEAQLYATARIYDEMLDVSIPVTDVEGIAVALVERVAERAPAE